MTLERPPPTNRGLRSNRGIGRAGSSVTQPPSSKQAFNPVANMNREALPPQSIALRHSRNRDLESMRHVSRLITRPLELEWRTILWREVEEEAGSTMTSCGEGGRPAKIWSVLGRAEKDPSSGLLEGEAGGLARIGGGERKRGKDAEPNKA